MGQREILRHFVSSRMLPASYGPRGFASADGCSSHSRHP
jgi:hypothetical protein